MLLVFLLGAGIWGLGHVMRAPVRARLMLLGILWVAVVLANLVLPETNGLRQATGGDARPWLVLAVIAAMVWAYRRGLRGLRGRAVARETASAPAPLGPGFSEAELNRYARHLMLREIGGPGQKALKNARVLVIGAGGLGSPALLYLAAAGVGTIGVIDDDTVDSSNLQRQIIHTDARLGMPKVFSAQAQVEALNPFVQLRPYNRRLTEENAAALFADYDLVLDGSDGFDTRYLVNRTAVAARKPLIAAAMTQWEGQIGLFDPAQGGPCYQCVFPQRPAPGLVPTCAEAGVAAPLPGIVGSMMAMEAIKHLTGAGETLRGALVLHDALYAETRKMQTKRVPDCPACGTTQG